VTIAMIQTTTTKLPYLIHNSLILLQFRLSKYLMEQWVRNTARKWTLVKVTVIEIVTANMALSVHREVNLKLFQD
jgi:hypothetical protein